jgi:D-alanyl-D-alanine dipeptidase
MFEFLNNLDRYAQLIRPVDELKPRSPDWKLVVIDKLSSFFKEELVPLGLFADRKYRRVFSDPVYSGLRPNSPYKREEMKGSLYACFVRKTVADMLAKAADHLPEGYALVVLDSYRPKEVQSSLYFTFLAPLWPGLKGAIIRDKNGVERPFTEADAVEHTQNFVSLPNIENMPHGTGGAVDAALIYFEPEIWAQLKNLDRKQGEIAGDPAKEAENFDIELHRQELFREHAQKVPMGPVYDKVAIDDEGYDMTAFDYFEKKLIRAREKFITKPSKYFLACAHKTLAHQKKFLKQYRNKDLIRSCYETIARNEQTSENTPPYYRAAFSFAFPLKTEVALSIRFASEAMEKFQTLDDVEQTRQLNAIAMKLGREQLFKMLRRPDVMKNLNVLSGNFPFHAIGDDVDTLHDFRARMEKIKNKGQSTESADAAYACYSEWLDRCEAKLGKIEEVPLMANWTKNAGYEVSFSFNEAQYRAESRQNNFTPLNEEDTKALWGRRMFYHVMTKAGFVIYAAEAWHVDEKNKFSADVRDLPMSEYGYARLSKENREHNRRCKKLYECSLKLSEKGDWVQHLYSLWKHGRFDSGSPELDADRIMPDLKAFDIVKQPEHAAAETLLKTKVPFAPQGRKQKGAKTDNYHR